MMNEKSSVFCSKWHWTVRDEMLSCKQWHNIKAVCESEASNEWEESRLGAADHMEPSPTPLRQCEPVQVPKVRVSCSLSGFGFLAFAFLVFLLKSIHMSSEEVRVRLKMKEVQTVDLSKRQNFKKNTIVSVLYEDQKRLQMKTCSTYHLKFDNFFGADLKL